MGATKNNMEDNLFNLENEKNLKLVAQEFIEENRELLEMVADRLVLYAQTGNSLALNWMAQSLIGLIKMANDSCKIKLGLDPEKMQ